MFFADFLVNSQPIFITFCNPKHIIKLVKIKVRCKPCIALHGKWSNFKNIISQFLLKIDLEIGEKHALVNVTSTIVDKALSL